MRHALPAPAPLILYGVSASPSRGRPSSGPISLRNHLDAVRAGVHPQFLVGGLTGILVANPTIDYQVNNSYFVLGHFH
jgi:hypothetical protein